MTSASSNPSILTPKITPEMVSKLKTALPTLTERDKRRVTELLSIYTAEITRNKGKDSLLSFIDTVYPGYKVGPHHRKMAKVFEDVEAGRLKRVMISIAPRFGKSEMISYLAPAWFLGKNPQKKIIMASHTADLAVNFGRRVRNLINSDSYKSVFPHVELQADSKSASRWGTNFGGEYFALGVGGAVAGKGADIFIGDDLHSEQEGKMNDPKVYAQAYEWYQSGPLQRLMPGGAIILVGTRWSKQDVMGQILEHSLKNEDADQWEVLEFPAILNGESLWPEFWPLEELLSKKASMDPRYWAAQYEQNPVAEEGALIKSSWWQEWVDEDPPPCEYIIMSLDTAQETNNRADYTSLQVWGVFKHPETENYNVILLNAIKERVEFPELKQMVYEQYKSWQPDSFIVEKKSNGSALYQEMRRSGVPVSEFTPGKGTDKIARVNSVTDLFSAGIVWAPDKRWAQEVIMECQDFPSGKNDDQVDAMTLALMRFRQGGFIRIPGDEPEPISYFKGRRNAAYY